MNSTLNTLFKVLESYTIEIPIVQRDYAQGRQDNHVNMVRYNILNDMKQAILGRTPPLDLNFVYGKVEDNIFLPIDGQQRLTTLFLLYLYAFSDDESKTDLLHKFTYATRISSRRFLKELVQKRFAIFESSLQPSAEIEDSEWFVSSWINDPTIQSVLIMLNDIKITFEDIDDIAQRLLKNEPIVFKFLEMKELGMEDSLYIKLNARGKPLTPLENFKARLIDRLQELDLDFSDTFKQNFDGKWTDLFWANSKDNFDLTYLTFFGVLFMNNNICQTDTDWSNRLDYTTINEDIFEIIFFTLNFLCDNKGNTTAYSIIFTALKENRTYKDRILFHAISTHIYMSKGIFDDSLNQWIRIIKNLTLNSAIEILYNYRRSIDGINNISGNWQNLNDYFSQCGEVSGFSQEQIKEEYNKSNIIKYNDIFAKEIYKAEQHPYFNGQIRSALHYSTDESGIQDINKFVSYWSKISLLFDNSKSKYGNLLRRALLSLGDYTLPVSHYKTLCVDDPDEAANTPSLKRLFSNHGNIVKLLLDSLNLNDDVEAQLKSIIVNSNVSKNEWRYCFIQFPQLFANMSTSHLRLCVVNGELITIRNKSASGYNNDVFLLSLQYSLQNKKIISHYSTYLGSWSDRFLTINNCCVRFKDKKFIITDAINTLFETKTDDPILEATEYLSSI